MTDETPSHSKDPSESKWDTDSPKTKTLTKFDDLKLSDPLLRGVYAYGFEHPSEIQEKGIPHIISGKDIIFQAPSGRGKTATFSIGALQRVEPSKSYSQVLILSPTRELAQQNYEVLKALGHFLPVTHCLLIGGTLIQADREALRNGAQMIVGTPGRVFDMIERGAFQSHKVHLLILDEADDMLSRGFKDQVHAIFKQVSPDVQVCLCSATMPSDILELSQKFMRDPVQILVPPEELTLKGIAQYYVSVQDDGEKFAALCDLYESLSITQAIIYCNTARKVDEITERLREQDFPISAMHGSMTPEERKLVLQEFRLGSSRVLITTDLLARGIDVQQVSLVINYELPLNRANYIHRIGRSGRYGRKGVSINIVFPEDTRLVRELEEHYAVTMMELPQDVKSVLKC